ncbi:Uncharacterized protein SCF082_LOCUS51855 [Durusdinium trenchii]|uniref:Uncharacterized protein n=1 Tax=Durusdinium trenchii TaxID=1381693 RepID=A0ABP0SHE4_9DINO
MASSSKPVTSKELAMAQDIVARASKAGVKDPEMTAGYGAMNDSSKRLRDGYDIELDEAWEPVTYTSEDGSLEKERLEAGSTSKQVPLKPEKKGENLKIPLPTGVSSTENWGTTVCRLPKVSALGLSYQELVAQKDHHKYLTWVQGHGLHRDGRFGDLAAYLERISPRASIEAQIQQPLLQGRQRSESASEVRRDVRTLPFQKLCTSRFVVDVRILHFVES